MAALAQIAGHPSAGLAAAAGDDDAHGRDDGAAETAMQTYADERRVEGRATRSP
jgi:hypothetical protein